MERNTHGRFSREQRATYGGWAENGEAKTTLRATEAEIVRLREKFPQLTEPVHDLGKTQLPANTFTVLGFIPLRPADVPEELRTMKLLR